MSKNSIFLVIVLCLFANASFAQNAPVGSYAKMKEAAFNGKYKSAKDMGRSLLAANPNNYDVSVLMARVYIWEQQYDSAQIVLDELLVKQPQYADALEAKFDLAFFTSNYQTVIQLGDSLVAQNPTRIEFKEKVALAHLGLAHNDIAKGKANDILAIDPTNKVALGILEQLRPDATEITVGYFLDQFSVPYERWWHVYTVGATKPMDWGSLAGRLNIGHLGDFSNGGAELQAEIESNINLSEKAYMMLLYGYSPSNYFPTHKASGEVWHKLPHQMVASLGGSYYYWDQSVFISTVSLEKYYNKYWFCLRNYLQYKDIGVTASWYATARRYFDDVDYAQIMLGFGAAPDEPFDVSDLNRQDAFSIRLAYLKKLNQRTKLRAGIGYSYEEYQQGAYRNRFEGGISVFYSLGK